MPQKSRTTRPAPKAAKASATKRTAATRKTATRATARKGASKSAKAFDHEAMMAAWQKTMAPAEGHRRLEPIVGTFACRTTFWMAPGQEPMVSEGVSEHRWVLGNRFVEQNYRGTMMGGPFEGIGYTGYDNNQKKYVGTWMDTMGTGIAVSEATGRPTDRAITFSCTCFDPLGSKKEIRTVVRIQDNDHHSFEVYRQGPNGKEFRNMLCEYTRK